ncbi:MAG: hypothetical protein ABL984_07675 [Pyrinomonadaceae bacterium]
MIRPQFWLLLIAFCLAFISAGASPQPTKSGFESSEGSFWVAVEGKPTARARARFDLGTFSLDGESLSWKEEDGTFTSLDHFYVFRERPNLTAAEKASIVDQYKKVTIKQFADLKIPTSEVPYTFAGSKGAEIRGVAARKLVTRIFFSGSRLVSFSYVRESADFDEHVALLNTFRQLTKAEHSAALIKDLTPESFSASPRDTRWQNDLLSAGIRGNVRRIFTEYQESTESPRFPSSDERFGRSGDLEIEIEYFDEHPSHFRTLGWLEGKRVVRAESTMFRLGEPGPNEKQITMITDIGPPPTEEELKIRDTRFDSRYERTYDSEGRIVTEKTIGNQGRIYSVKTFSWKPEQKVTVSGGGRGDFYNKTIEVIGADGHVSEERSCDETEKECDISLYKYENDPKGNWIVKRSFEKQTVRGKVSLKPSGTYFRKIEYFD